MNSGCRYEQTIVDDEEDEEEDEEKEGKTSVKLGPAEQHRAVRIFQAFDADGNGVIQTAELVRGLKDKDASELIMNIDDDENGSINIAEWLGYLSEVQDKNSDTMLRLYLTRCEEGLGLWKQTDEACQKFARQEMQEHVVEATVQRVSAHQSSQELFLQDNNQPVLQELLSQMSELTQAVQKLQGDVDNLTGAK